MKVNDFFSAIRHLLYGSREDTGKEEKGKRKRKHAGAGSIIEVQSIWIAVRNRMYEE